MLECVENIFVKSYDVNLKKELSIYSFFNYMQEMAWRHAEELGFGYDFVTKKQMFWVLSKVKLDIRQAPKWGDKINLTTWPRGAESIYALRDFVFTNESGEVLATATSYWLILDIKTQRPQRPSTALDNVYSLDKKALDEKLQKIVISGEKMRNIERTAYFNDIDVNNHVNNAVYVKWSIDAFSPDFMANNTIKSIQINFVSELKIGEKISVSLYNVDNKTFYVDGVINETGATIFQSKIEFV